MALMTSVAERLHGLVDEAMTSTERSLYAAEKKIGVSDIGGCHEYVRRLIANEDFSDPRTDYLAAFVGTAMGKELAAAYIQRFPDARAEVPVTVSLVAHGLSISLPGHADIVHDNTVTDFKSKDSVRVVAKESEKDDGLLHNKFQLTLYAAALIQSGDLDEDCTLALAYYDRSGVEQEPFVVEWTYNPAILEAAQEWLGDVVYALVHGEEASKDKPRTFCESYCAYFTACRGSDTDVEGLIEDTEILTAIELYVEASAREKEAKADKAAAAAALKGIAGNTTTHTLRWINVGESVIPETRRKEHQRMSLTKRK
jgi:PD-(D/E)XK nuclease superfamily